MQLRGLPPFYSPKYDLKQHPNYRFTAEADKGNAIDEAALVTRRMAKLDPSEEYALFTADVPDNAITDEDIRGFDDVDEPDAYE